MNDIIDNKRLYTIEIIGVIFLMVFGLSTNVGMIALIVLLSISMFFLSDSDSFSLVLFFYPFANLLKLNSSGLSFIYVLMVVFIVKLLFKGKVITYNNRILFVFLLLILLILYESLMCLAFAGKIEADVIILRIAIPFVFLISVCFSSEKINVKTAVFSLSFSCIIAGAIFLGSEAIPVLKSRLIIKGSYMFSNSKLIRLNGLSGNPNIYSFILNICIASLLSIYEKEKKHFLYYLLLTLLSVLGIMTLSKSFAFAFVLTFGLFFFRAQKKIKVSSVVILLLVLTAIIVYVNNSTYFSALMSRLTDNEGGINELASSRSEIWFQYIKYIFSHFIVLMFGVSLEGPMLRIYGNEIGTHNAFIESLYYFGIVGSLLLLFLLFFLFNYSFRKKDVLLPRQQKTILSYLPLVVYIFRIFAITLLFRIDFAFLTGIVFIVMKYKKY